MGSAHGHDNTRSLAYVTCSLELVLGELIKGQPLHNLPLACLALHWEGENDVLHETGS